MATTLTLQGDSSLGVVLRSVQGSDGASVTFPNGPAFRLVVHDLDADSFQEVSVENASAWVLLQDPYERVAETPIIGSDLLGSRKELVYKFSIGFTLPGRGRCDVEVTCAATILDLQNDRIRFSCWWQMSSPRDRVSIAYVEPCPVRMPKASNAYYLIGVNGGMATGNPGVDMIGSNDYMFLGSSRPYREIEGDNTPRMEVLFPGALCIDASAYWDCAGKSIVMVHGDMSMRPSVIRDWFDGSAINLQSQVQQPNFHYEHNKNQATGLEITTADGVYGEAHRYLCVFNAVGGSIGEECGTALRNWMLSSVEAQSFISTKARDRADMADYNSIPMWIQTLDAEDLEGGHRVIEASASEVRAVAPAGAADKLSFSSRQLLDFARQDNSASHPAPTLDAVPDLFDLKYDPEKAGYLGELRSASSIYGVGYTRPRKPQPFDPGNYWSTAFGGGMSLDLAIRRNWKEVENVQTRTIGSKVVSAGIVANFIFDGTHTKIGVSNSYNNTTFDTFSEYKLGSHPGHSKHLGTITITHLGTPTTYPLERVLESDYTANSVHVAGDITASLSFLDPVLMVLGGNHTIPGYEPLFVNTITPTDFKSVAFTSLCTSDDDHASLVDPPVLGPYVKLGSDTESLFAGTGPSPTGAGLYFQQDNEDMVCHRPHILDGSGYAHDHSDGEHLCLSRWRNVLVALRAKHFATYGQWMIFNDGAYGLWSIGATDGNDKSFRKNDLTTKPGSWGASPLWSTVFGDFQRTGFYGNRGRGHLWQFNEAVDDPLDGVSGTPSTTDADQDAKVCAREALAFDWLHGRKLPTLGLSTSSNLSVGTTPTGTPAYTPFFEAGRGIDDLNSTASMFARMLRCNEIFGLTAHNGRRVRSWRRINTTSINSAVGNQFLEGHDIGSEESGTTRSLIMHSVVQDTVDPRKTYAIFVNDGTETRGDVYEMDPAIYVGQVPGDAGSYLVKCYEVEPLTYSVEDLGVRSGPFQFSLRLDPGRIAIVEMTFQGGLFFKYRYDEEAFTEVPVNSGATRQRITNIHGHGERFQFMFESHVPDESIRISEVNLRIHPQGASEAP